MRRSKTKWEPICHWCRTAPVASSTYRTPSEMIAVPYKVCGPSCPERPDGAVCYRAGSEFQ